MVRIARHSLVAIALLVATAAPALAQPAHVTSAAVPAPAKFFGGRFQLHFTPEADGALSTALADFVKSAKASVDVAIFDIDHAGFVDALMDRHAAGVRVRVVTDSEHDNPVLAPLKAAKLVRYDKRQPFMHAKLVVVDGRKLFAGSANATSNAFTKEDNNAFFISSVTLATRTRQWIDKLYDDGKFGPGRPIAKSKPSKVGEAMIEILFAPEDPVMERVVDEIKKAKKEVRFFAFNLSHPEIVSALIDAKKRGVVVEGVVDGSLWLSGYGPSKLAAGGVNVRLDGNPSLMHDKVIVVDKDTVVTGSFNFSSKATEKNDEDLVVIQSKTIAKEYLRAYGRIFAMSKPLPKKPATTLVPATSTPGLVGSVP